MSLGDFLQKTYQTWIKPLKKKKNVRLGTSRFLRPTLEHSHVKLSTKTGKENRMFG